MYTLTYLKVAHNLSLGDIDFLMQPLFPIQGNISSNKSLNYVMFTRKYFLNLSSFLNSSGIKV